MVVTSNFPTWFTILASLFIQLSLSNCKLPLSVTICYLKFHRISAICHYLSEDVTQKLLCVFFILSRLDYCNTLLVSCPKYLLSKLHKIQNNAARLIFQTPRSARVLLCFTVFLFSRESSTTSGCCVLKSSLIRPLPVSQTFTFTLILVSSIVRQTP